MSAFQQLMASVGVGSTTLFLRATERTVHPGDTAMGTLKLTGGDVAQDINTLTVSLIKVTSNGQQTQQHTINSEILATGLHIEPHSAQTFSWAFPIPDNAARGSYIVAANADISHAVNPHDSLGLTGSLHREFFAIDQAMKQLGFVRAGDLQPGLRHDVHAVYYPPRALKEQIQTVELRLSVGTGITGKLILSYVGKSAGEQVKSFFGINAQEFPLEFHRVELVNAEREMTPQGAVPLLKKVLAESLILPDNQANWMLRASQAAPTSSGELLRPASETGATKPNELMRPVETPHDIPR